MQPGFSAGSLTPMPFPKVGAQQQPARYDPGGLCSGALLAGVGLMQTRAEN